MTQKDSQVPWTDEQWARIEQAIQQEASRARLAAGFLPVVGPLSGNTDFVREERVKLITDRNGMEGATAAPQKGISIRDREIIQLRTLQVRVYLRGAQLSDPEMTSALALFRRAANYVARLEDAVIFNGVESNGDVQNAPPVAEIRGGEGTRADGLLKWYGENDVFVDPNGADIGEALVSKVSEAIGNLEGFGHYGPFAVVLSQSLFLQVQTPNRNLVLPQDRIIPFLGGGPLLRSSLIDDSWGVVVALGGAPVELVVAKDMSPSFMQVTPDPTFIFRVYERVALRIKEPDAIQTLGPIPGVSPWPTSP